MTAVTSTLQSQGSSPNLRAVCVFKTLSVYLPPRRNGILIKSFLQLAGSQRLFALLAKLMFFAFAKDPYTPTYLFSHAQ